MAEKSKPVESQGSIGKELSILHDVEERILNLFENSYEKELAKIALFDHLYTDLETHTNYLAPNAHSLPYLLQILAAEQDLSNHKIAESLFSVPLDVKNIRLANDTAKSENAGDLAIALNLASLFTRDESGKLSAFGIRHSGDELLCLTTSPTLDPLVKATKKLNDVLGNTYPALKGGNYGPAYKYTMPIPLSVIDLTKSRRNTDIVANLYNPSQDGQYLNSPRLNSLISTNFSHKQIKARELAGLPTNLKILVEQSGNTETAKRLALHAALNEMYPRNEPVYTHAQFFAAITEKQAANPQVKYRPIFLGPIGIKALNSDSHTKGDTVMKNTNHLLRTHWSDVTVTQDRGSFIAWVPDSRDFDKKIEEINNSITDEKIHNPTKYLEDPAVVVTPIHVDTTPSNEGLFWQAVDLHRPTHYFHELSLFLEKLSPHTVWKSLTTRLTTRIEQIREIFLNNEPVMRLLTLHDLHLLDQKPTDFTTGTEFAAYSASIKDFISRINWVEKYVRPPRLRLQSSSALAST